MYQIAHLPASISRCLQSVADRRGDDVSEKHVPISCFTFFEVCCCPQLQNYLIFFLAVHFLYLNC